MNKYLRALVVVPTGFLKTLCLKVFHPTKFKGVQFAQVSPFTEITLDGGGLEIGRGLKMRDGAKIRVRRGAICKIGKNVSINSNNMIACHDSVVIGDNVEFSPNVQIYDHDHDFRAEGGIKAKKYKTGTVVIGNNVWIGCNSVIAAGSVVKGEIAANSVLVQPKSNDIRNILYFRLEEDGK